VAGGLGDEEDADQRDEEHEVAEEAEEEAEAYLREPLAGAATALRLVVPVVAVAVAAGAFVDGGWLAARAVVAFVGVAMAVDFRRCQDRRHGRLG